jgi:hypothetical protein
MTASSNLTTLELDNFDHSRRAWMGAVEADPRYGRFSVEEAEATFTSAGFARVPQEEFAWGDTVPGTDWPCACFDRSGVWVAAHRLGYEVFAPGDGSLMSSFPDAELAIRFVRAFEREAELMAADGFSDEEFGRVQSLASEIMQAALREAEETRERLRWWLGLEDQGGDDAGPASGSISDGRIGWSN